nr:plasmid recombination protein [Klebsiella michiganensis]
MANYAIMRCKKLTGMGSVASALQHCYRERETPNANAERTPENYCSVSKSTDQAMGRVRELLPEKRRKDAVLAVEYVMTASPEWWKEATPRQQAEFFARSEQWLEKKYGKDRVVAAVVHRDEATPHLSAFVVPLTQDGRLSAKEFIGGRIREGSCCGGGGSPGRGHPAPVCVRGAIDAGWTAVRERVYWRAVKDA